MYGKNMNRTLAYFPKNLISIFTKQACTFPKRIVKKTSNEHPQNDVQNKINTIHFYQI